MKIEEMNCEQKLQTIKEAFDYIGKRNGIIFRLEDKINELGGDPWFYMTEEEKDERRKFKTDVLDKFLKNPQD